MSRPFQLAELELAFSLHVVRQILQLTGTTYDARADFLHATAGKEVAESSEFVVDGEMSPRWEEALGEALLELPTRLSVDARLQLLQSIYQGALFHAQVDYVEGTLLVRAARLLGLSPRQFTARLEQMIGTESIDLPAPEVP